MTGRRARGRRRTGARRRAIPDLAGTSAALQLPPPTGRGAGNGGRWGLVLGGGGVLGGAWMIGALDALERSRGVDARDAELIIGTSAGSVVGSLLAGGVSVAELVAQQRAEETITGPAADEVGAGGDADDDAGDEPGEPGDPEEPGASRSSDGNPLAAGIRVGSDDLAGPPFPPRPRLVPGNPRLLARNARRIRQMPPTAFLVGLVPSGRASMPAVAQLIDDVVPPGSWAAHPGLRVIAVDYQTGERVAFGAPGAPETGLSQAVLASCAIPGWFTPVEIGGVPYVDGGVWSATNVDLAIGAGLDEIIVLAPMVSLRFDDPDDWRARLERRWRRRVTRRCLAEARQLQRTGTGVTLVGPGPEDLDLIGFNLMAAGRRRVVIETSQRTSLAALDAPATVSRGRIAAATAGEPEAALPGGTVIDIGDRPAGDVSSGRG